MRIIKCSILFSLVCMLCCFTVNAASEAYEQKINAVEKNSDITVVIKAAPNGNAGLQIIKPNADFPPVSGNSSEIADTFAYLGEASADEYGFASYTLNVGEDIGEYTIRSDCEIIRAEVSPDYNLFAFSWPWAYDSKPFMDYGYEYLYESKWLAKSKITDNGTLSKDKIVSEAKRIKELLDKDPVGKRSITIDNGLCGMLLEGAVDYVYVNQQNLDTLKSYLSAFFEEFKSIGGEVDYVWIDYEKSFSVYTIRTAEIKALAANEKNQAVRDLFIRIGDNNRYVTEIKPALAEYGFEFCEDEFELYNLSIPDNVSNDSCIIWNTVMENKLRGLINDYIYTAIKEHYPDVKFSNYGDNGEKAWYKIPSYQGAANYKGGNLASVGTHSSVASYVRPYRVDGIPFPKDIMETTYPLTAFNVLRYAQNEQRVSYLSNPNHLIQPWVPFYGYDIRETEDAELQKAAYVTNTPYYPELIYHIAMLNPDPFLFYGPVLRTPDTFQNQIDNYLDERAGTFSKLLSEINSLVGYKDRASLVDEMVSWTKPYIISGMRANGRDIYRITPDISTGVTKEAFCINTSTPTFEIGGEIISFPGGEIITPETDIESYGYWVEVPEGTKPSITYSPGSSELYMKLELYNREKGIVPGNKLPNEGVTARFEVRNNSSASKNITLIMAQYSDEGLCSVIPLENKSFASGEEKIIVKEFPHGEILSDTKKLAFFIWDGYGNLFPYEQKYELVKG